MCESRMVKGSNGDWIIVPICRHLGNLKNTYLGTPTAADGHSKIGAEVWTCLNKTFKHWHSNIGILAMAIAMPMIECLFGIIAKAMLMFEHSDVWTFTPCHSYHATGSRQCNAYIFSYSNKTNLLWNEDIQKMSNDIYQFCRIGRDCDRNGDRMSKNHEKLPYYKRGGRGKREL